MKVKLLLSILALLAAGPLAEAQFYSLGSDPGSVKWSQIETDAYRIVYPSGMDSLARVYAVNLESARRVIGNSAGFVPNGSYRKKHPVILHNYSATDNGMVTWAPRRTDLLTIPSPYNPEAYPNESLLSLHESRHVAQMQFGNAYPFRWLNVVFGEMATGALSAVYPGPALLEGDAVAAETALTNSGRGRNGDFLEYYRVSFSEGVNRNWWQWRWGSFNKYTPDYYRAGYLLVAGMRKVYDEPDFTARYYERIKKHHGIAFGNLQKTIHETSGKSLESSFKEISSVLKAEWEADRTLRGPFPEARQITSPGKYFTAYGALEAAGDVFYAVRGGIAESASLVRIKADGTQTRISSFASNTSGLVYDAQTGRLYWSEQLPDPRWELRSFSDIRYLDPSGKTRNLTSGERFFNPAADGSVLAVVEYPAKGGSKVVVLDADTGEKIESIAAPDGMQVVEPVWVEGELYASAVVEGGSCIIKVRGFDTLLGPVRAKINDLGSDNGVIFFTSDINGVNELYSLNPSDKVPMQWSNTPDGASDFRFNATGDSLWCAILSTKGRDICVIPASPKPVDFTRPYDYHMADGLSSGEKEMFNPGETEISGVEKYSKLGHLFKFHSWAPLYVDTDRLSSMSLESVSQLAGLGATALFQNELGSAWGTVAYHAGHSSDGWHHSGHARITYEGWYPAIQAGIDFGDRYARSSTIVKTNEKNTILTTNLASPLANYYIKTYVPLTFNRGGLLKGLVPQIAFNGTNDLFEGKYVGSLSASVRAYVMQRTPASAVYPRLGIGVEVGGYTRPGLESWFCPNAYAHIYGYLPGIDRTHGIRLSAKAIRNFATGSYVNATGSNVPRGFPASANAVVFAYPTQLKLSFDYALPFASLDWAGLCPLFYLKNLELDPHADWTAFGTDDRSNTGNLFSIGADFKLVLSNLLWLPFPVKIGVSYNYNGGSAFDRIAKEIEGIGRHSVEMIFSVSM